MKNSKKIIIVFVVLLIVVVGYFVASKKDKNIQTKSEIKTKKDDVVVFEPLGNKILVQSEEGEISRLEIETGKTSPASAIEKDDFTGFAGLPKFGVDSQIDTEQSFSIVSQDKTKAILSVAKYDLAGAQSAFDGSQPLVQTSEFVCDIAEKKCDPSNLLFGKYEGLDPKIQTQYGPIWWISWDSQKNVLIGHLAGEGTGNSSPVYVCNIQSKFCNKTEGYDALKKGDIKANAPEGLLATSGEKFVLVNQNDAMNEKTGKSWELLLYNVSDLSKPALKYDISLAINRNEKVEYDSVQSVSWSKDEKKIAIATDSQIFMLDFATGKLNLIYSAPIDADGEYSFDGSGMLLSGDQKFIVFTDSQETVTENPADEENQNVDVTNILKKIDLSDGNKISELLRGSDLIIK
ncbi:MAG: hypothetical protein WCI36_01915 [bacterium]